MKIVQSMSLIVGISLFQLVSTAQVEAATTVIPKCSTESKLKPILDKYFSKSTLGYQLVKVSGVDLQKKILAGSAVDIPLMNEKGETSVFTSKASRFQDKYPLTQGFLKISATQTRAENLPALNAFKFGCGSADSSCGYLTFHNASSNNYEGVFANKTYGMAAIETVSSLLLHLTGKKQTVEDGCSIVYNYNTLGHFPIEGENFSIDFNSSSYQQQLAFHDAERERIEQAVARALEPRLPVRREINIVLDSDGTYNELDHTSVYLRQRAIMFGISLIYGWIEPHSGKSFGIDFNIKGQETWVAGAGPTATDPQTLTDEINAADYYTVVNVGRNELSLFLIAYDMDRSTLGQAGSICMYPGYDDGYGSDVRNQKTHAWSQQVVNDDSNYTATTYLGRVILSAHEVGHLVGATHEAGALNECAGGDFAHMCGTTIMLSGAAGGAAPDYRMPFFSRANDMNILGCLIR